MNPSRELDALVAEKVMGLKIGKRKDQISGEFYKTFDDCGKPPPYSTDIAAAWEVVEKLNKILFICSILGSPGGNFKVEIHAHVHRPAYDEWRRKLVAEGVADTAPHAICLAALKAVGVEIE